MSDADSARELARRARMLLARTGGRNPLESRELRDSLREHLTVAEARESLIDLELANLGEAEVSPAVAVATADVTSAAVSAMEKAETGNASNLTDFEVVSLEAIVQLTGRPAMRYTDGRVELPPNDVGDNDNWLTFVVTARSKINAASASVGQVALASADGTPSQALGTAWRLGDDLAVTNRHVASQLVRNNTLGVPKWTLDPHKPSLVDFNVTDNATTVKRFAITALVYCAEEPTVDLAILRLDPKGQALPAALKLDFDAASVGREVPVGGVAQFKGEEVYVVGHPFRQFASSQSLTVFGKADAFKRCSPGVVTTIPTREHAFEHDCSTLGGNSGSCVLTVGSHKVVGLHYGGASVDEATGMGRANLALGLARLGEHRAAAILKAGHVT